MKNTMAWKRKYGLVDEARKIALSATRSYLRKQGIEPSVVDAKHALAALDDLQFAYPDKICAFFSAYASDTQIALFVREWKQWLEDAKGLQEARKYE